MKRIILFLISTLAFVATFAQSCYTENRNRGLQLFEQGKYNDAVAVFEAAKDCPDLPANNDLDTQISRCKAKLRAVSTTPAVTTTPSSTTRDCVKITGVEFCNADKQGNIIDDYGSPLYAPDIKYLQARFNCESLVSNDMTADFYVKIYKPDGSLRHSSSSPDGYTFADTGNKITPYTTRVLLIGWGSADGGTYEDGTYHYEIWCKGRKLYATSFTLLKRSGIASSSSAGRYVSITRMEFGNADKQGNIIDDYGSTLYAEDLKYLQARFHCNSLVSSTKTVDFDIKIYKPDGSLDQASSSPEGYTLSDKGNKITPETTRMLLIGWGNAEGGTYKAGDYRYEVWCEGVKLYSTTVTIHSRSSSSPGRYVSITRLEFCNADNDGNLITEYGAAICAPEVKYLQARFYCNSLVSSTQSVDFYVKIYDPDGSLRQSSTSPTGYTFADKGNKITPNTARVVLLGWGNSDGGTYTPGTYRYEVWCEGVLLYSTNLTMQSRSSSRTASVTGTGNGMHNGHEYVDLGLSVKWATCNIGADKPSGYGFYYAWGETSLKASFTEANSRTYNKSISDFSGNADYDTARANWGGSWRMPTADEVEELVDKCNCEWTTIDGNKGVRLTSKINGNSIFLPAAGYWGESEIKWLDIWGCYWNSTPYSSLTEAQSLYFTEDTFINLWDDRDEGHSIRAVVN